MNKFRGLIMGGCFLILSGCTGYSSHSEVEALNEAKAVGSPFTQKLADEYRAFANSELHKMFDYPDALHFARKGLAAAAGEIVMPEPISDWNLNEDHVKELAEARGRLINIFDKGGREVSPKKAAMAQASFDCWIEQQEENWQLREISQCKNRYLRAIKSLENKLKRPASKVKAAPPERKFMPPVMPVPVPDASTPMKPEDAMYLVFFDFDSFKLGSGGKNVLNAVADEIKKYDHRIVNIVGHTDSSGPVSYNERLALRRAKAIRRELLSRGVDRDVLKIYARGENELLVKTPDGVREPANRRGEITFGTKKKGTAAMVSMASSPKMSTKASKIATQEGGPWYVSKEDYSLYQSETWKEHCTMSKEYYGSGITLTLAKEASANSATKISFYDPTLDNNKTYKVVFHLPSGVSKTYKIRPYETKQIEIVLGRDRAFWGSLSREEVLVITLDNKGYGFGMAGAKNALKKMESCLESLR